MDKSDVFNTLKATGIVPVIRTDTAAEAREVVTALEDGGLPVAEITMTIPGAIGLIAELIRDRGDRVLIGAGTVTDEDTCRRVLEAGSRFIVTPTVNREVVAAGVAAGVCVIGGALTPTEILAVWRAGAAAVKVFPASAMGAGYLAMLRDPFPGVPLVPTGGITLESLGDYLGAGAAFVGAGGDLVSRDAVKAGDQAGVRERARQYVQAVRAFRQDRG